MSQCFWIAASLLLILSVGCDEFDSPSDEQPAVEAGIDEDIVDIGIPDDGEPDSMGNDALAPCGQAQHCGGDLLAVANCRCPEDAPICLRQCSPCSQDTVGHRAQSGEVCVEPGELAPPCDPDSCRELQMRCGGDPRIDGGCVPIEDVCWDDRFAAPSTVQGRPSITRIMFLSPDEPQPGFGEVAIECGERPAMALLIEVHVDVEETAVPLSLSWIGLDDVVRDRFLVEVGQGLELGAYVYRGAFCWEEYAETLLRLQVVDSVGRASPPSCGIAAVDASGQ